MDIDRINDRIADVHRGRRWIITNEAAAGTTGLVERLRARGAESVMVVASVEGVGDPPDADRIHFTRTTAPTIMESIRVFSSAIEEPSPALLAAVDAFDPTGTAMVLGQGHSRSSMLAGRPVYGVRERRWRDLEDKTVVDELWDQAGVARAPSALVSVDDAPEAARTLGSDLGTVWAADNREGWHGGGEYTRWVRDDADLAQASAWFAEHADMVRVMPFLDGLPCSIHGFVTDDGVAVFEPLELFIFRHVGTAAFLYAQGGNFWTPDPTTSDVMRSAARAVGRWLHDRLGYRGGFGIDGVCTTEGFLPTELNPRLTLGHAIQAQAAEVPLGDMERLLLAGDLEIAASDLEDTVVAANLATRGGGMMFTSTGTFDAADTGFSFTDDGATPVATDAADADGVMLVGPSAFGSVVIVRFEPARTPIGPSLAPRGPLLMSLANAMWDVGLPEVTAAPDPRG